MRKDRFGGPFSLVRAVRFQTGVRRHRMKGMYA